MNILVFSWRDPKNPLAGGAEQVMHEHMKGWVVAGHKVYLFTAEFDKCKKEEMLDGIKIIRRGNPLFSVYIKAVFWYLLENSLKFDIIVDQFHGIPFFTPLYVRTKKIAVIQEVAKEVWFLNHLKRPLNLIYGTIGYFIEPFEFIFYRQVPFITGSESAKNDLLKMGIPSQNIYIINHGVLIPKIKKEKKNKIPTIIFLGALAKDKGIEDALKAFSILNKKGKYQFWIVGKGSKEYLNYLKLLSKELRINRMIKFWGFVDINKKFELLGKSHILINPSFREGWGLVNIEANLMGTPVVAYRSQGLIDSVKNAKSGLLCDINTPDNLALKIDKIVKDKEFQAKLEKESIIWAKNFTWEKSKKKSLKLIENIK